MAAEQADIRRAKKSREVRLNGKIVSVESFDPVTFARSLKNKWADHAARKARLDRLAREHGI